MKRVLLPTDFSDNAYNAMRYAMQFLKNEQCVFYILNTFTPVSYSVGYLIESAIPYDLKNVAMMTSKKEVDRIEEKLKDAFKNSKHSFIKISTSNLLISEIKEIMKKHTIDFIVMGTKGATGAKEIFMGSTTQKVIRTIKDCPILVIPEDILFDGTSEIGFATNFERVYFKSEIKTILNLAKMSNSTVRIIHIYDTPERTNIQNYNSNNLESYFKRTAYEFHVISDFSTIEKGIQAFIEELEIDILAMINYEHSFIERLTREPVIKKMTFHTKVPFLVIPADN